MYQVMPLLQFASASCNDFPFSWEEALMKHDASSQEPMIIVSQEREVFFVMRKAYAQKRPILCFAIKDAVRFSSKIALLIALKQGDQMRQVLNESEDQRAQAYREQVEMWMNEITALSVLFEGYAMFDAILYRYSRRLAKSFGTAFHKPSPFGRFLHSFYHDLLWALWREENEEEGLTVCSR